MPVFSTTFSFKWFALFGAVVISCALGWSVTKTGLNYLSPLWYTTIRMIIGTVTMMSLVITLKKFSLPTWRDFPLIFIIGILQISLCMLLANLGLNYLPPGRASFILYTTPLWVMPATLFLFKEKLTHLRWVGFGFGLVGILLLINPWEFQWAKKEIVFGISMLLLASFSFAISILGARYLTWTKSPLELMPWQLLIGTIPMFVYACFKEPEIEIILTPALFFSLLYTGVLVTGFAYWGNVVISKELPSMLVSLGLLLVPVCSLIISAIYHDEIIDSKTVMGALCILIGVGCVVIEEKT